MNRAERTKLIVILGAVAAIGPLSIDMYLPGFSAIAKDLDTTIGKVSMSLTAYFIGISLGQVVYGPILDRFGRIKPLLFGFGLYLLAAVASALAPDIYSFIGMRFLLALGGCVGMVAARAMIRDNYEGDGIARAFSSLILVIGVAPIIAPTLGGYVVAWLGWRYIFWFLAAYSFILLFLVRFFLDDRRGPDHRVNLKPRAVLINYWSVMKNADFRIYGLSATIGLAGMFTYISGSPFVFMDLLGLTEEQFGWFFGANALGFIGGSQINKALLRKRDSAAVSFGMSMLTLASTLYLLVNVYLGLPNLWAFLGGLFSFTLSLGFVNPNLQALALQPFKQNAGVASALIGSIRMMGGAVASGLVGLLHNGTAYPMVGLMLLCAVSVFTILLLRRVT